MMVVDQLRDYLEHGNVANAVNFPAVAMARESAYRVAIANANVPNMLGQISTAMAHAGLNIHNMVNKSRGDMAYTLVDVDSPVAPGVLADDRRDPRRAVGALAAARHLEEEHDCPPLCLDAPVLQDRLGPGRPFFLAARAGQDAPALQPPAGVDPHRAGESVLRNCDGKKVTARARGAARATGSPNAERTDEIPFVVARVVLQDFTGVPLLADLAAMRNVAAAMGKDPKTIEPLVPVDLVVDHSVQVDHYGNKDALDLNMKLEFQRNRERYQFMKWGMQAFDTFGVVPPGFGIVHQVNLEYLARGVHKGKDGVLLPRHPGRHRQPHHHDQRHRRGRLGRGRHRGRGRHAGPAGVLPDARRGRRRADRQAARGRHRHRPGADRHRDAAQATRWSASSSSSSAKARARWRCPTARPSPTWRPNTARRWASSRSTRRPSSTSRAPAARQSEIEAFEAYFKAQGLFGMPQAGEIDYTQVVEARPGHASTPSLAGPKRPQDRIELGQVEAQFAIAVQQAGGRERLQPDRPTKLAQRLHDARRAWRSAQRRRADRRHHLLHQHLQPRACCWPPACWRRRRSRPG